MKQKEIEAKRNKWFYKDCDFLMENYCFKYGSFEWFKRMSDRYFGGGFTQDYLKAGITREQLVSSKEKGVFKV